MPSNLARYPVRTLAKPLAYAMPEMCGLVADYDFSDKNKTKNRVATAITRMLSEPRFGQHTDSQGTAAKRPALTADQANGYQGAVFDNGDTLIGTNVPVLGAIIAGANTTYVVSRGSTGRDYIYVIAEDAGARNLMTYESAVVGRVNFQSRTADGNAISNDTNIDNAKYSILAGRRSGTTQALGIKGGAETTNASGQNETGGNRMYIGSRLDVDAFLTGAILRILNYTGSHSAAQRARTEIHLANMYKLYHPRASWIGNFNSAKQAFIHVNRLDMADAVAAFNIVKAWYKAEAEFLTLVSGTTITQMLDVSGNGNHTAVQGTATRRPTFSAATLNGKGVSTWAADTLVLPSALYAIPAADNGAFAVSNRTSNDAAADRLFGMTQGGSSRWALTYGAAADTASYRSQDSVGTTVDVTGFTEANYIVLNSYKSGTTQAIQLNNGTAVTDLNGVNEPDINGALMGSGIETLFLAGNIAEGILCNALPSANQILWFNRYLASQFNITIA